MRPAYVLLFAGLASGCVAVGPKTIPRDRFEYSTAIGESWKRQTLLNIVKLRYLDPPLFVDVGQIVAGYSLETAVNVGGQLSSDDAVQGNTVSAGAAGRFIDRPTITYVPLTGNKFVKGLLTPLPPDSIFFLVQSGWPADAVLSFALSSINGLKNQTSGLGGVTPPEPEFLRLMELMRRIQASGAVAMRVMKHPDGLSSTLMSFRSTDIPQETLADGQELRRLLRVDPDASEFNLVFGATAMSNKELAVVTRSLLQLLMVLGAQVDVPAQHLSDGRVSPGWETIPGGLEARWFRVATSTERPEDAFAAVEYRDQWFWIDDRDLRSKRALTLVMLLFTLADTGEREGLPLITIPAQ